MTESVILREAAREKLRPLTAKIWMWSVFSAEKGLYFNGFILSTPQGCLIVDPPSAPDEVFNQVEMVKPVLGVLLTNRDHERVSHLFRERLQVPVFASQADAPLLEREPEKIYQDGEVLWGLFQMTTLSDQKSPGESVLYWAEQNTLILGDALIGKPAGSLSMLPADKYVSPNLALAGLKSLADYFLVEAVLPADGEPILKQGGRALEQFFKLQEPTPHG